MKKSINFIAKTSDVLLDRGSLPSEINCQDLPEGQARTSCGPQLGPRDCLLSLPNTPGGTVASWEAGAGETVNFKCRVQSEHPGFPRVSRGLLNGSTRQAPCDSQNAPGFPPHGWGRSFVHQQKLDLLVSLGTGEQGG